MYRIRNNRILYKVNNSNEKKKIKNVLSKMSIYFNGIPSWEYCYEKKWIKSERNRADQWKIKLIKRIQGVNYENEMSFTYSNFSHIKKISNNAHITIDIELDRISRCTFTYIQK